MCIKPSLLQLLVLSGADKRSQSLLPPGLSGFLPAVTSLRLHSRTSLVPATSLSTERSRLDVLSAAGFAVIDERLRSPDQSLPSPIRRLFFWLRVINNAALLAQRFRHDGPASSDRRSSRADPSLTVKQAFFLFFFFLLQRRGSLTRSKYTDARFPGAYKGTVLLHSPPALLYQRPCAM